MPKAAKITANGLARPSKRVSSPGTPNMPLPMTLLITNAVIVQRPMDRTNAIVSPHAAKFSMGMSLELEVDHFSVSMQRDYRIEVQHWAISHGVWISFFPSF